jgi:hypothetical protein
VPEPEEEAHEYKDDANVHQKPSQQVVAEEQDVGAQDRRYQREHIDDGDHSTVHATQGTPCNYLNVPSGSESEA